MNFAQDCAFDRNTGNLFLAYNPELFSGVPGLYWINTTNGGAFLIEDFPNYQSCTGLAIPYSLNNPIDLSISVDSSDICLNWNAISDAIAYNVYCSESPQGGFQLTATTSNSFWSQQQDNSAMFYRIAAVFSDNRNMQIPLSELIKTNPKNPIPLMWKSNLISETKPRSLFSQ